MGDPETGSLWSNLSRASFLHPLDHHSRSSISTVQDIDRIERTGTLEGLGNLGDSVTISYTPAVMAIAENSLEVKYAEIVSKIRNRFPKNA